MNTKLPMINKLIKIFITILFLASAFSYVGAAEYVESDSPRQEVTLSPEAISKKMPSFMFNLKRYVEEAQKNINIIDNKMRKDGTFYSNNENERQAMVYAQMADVLYHKGQLQEAIEQYQQARLLTKIPQLKSSLIKSENKARVELEREKKAEQKILSKDNKDGSLSPSEDYLCKGAIKLYNQGEYSDALDGFNKVLIINPNNKIAKKYIQNIFLKGKDEPAPNRKLDKDRDELDKGEFISKTEEYLCSLGVVYYQRGDSDDARIEFEKALMINPNSRIAQDYLSRIASGQVYQPKDSAKEKSGPMESVFKFFKSLF